MENSEYYVFKIMDLNKKNEKTDGYSLGDVLLLQKFENDLIKKFGYTREGVEALSPSYYKK